MNKNLRMGVIPGSSEFVLNQGSFKICNTKFNY